MTPEQLARERRRGRFAAAAAFGSGIAFAVGAFWYQAINSDAPDGDRDAAVLRYFERHGGEYLGASLLQALGILLLIVVAVHLYRATKDRNPDQSPVVLAVGVYGPAAFAASTTLRAITLTVLADDFAGRAVQTERAAEGLLDTPVLVVGTILGLTGRARARLLARQGIAGRDAARAPHEVHGGARDRARPRAGARLRAAGDAAVAVRARDHVRRLLAARRAPGMEHRTRRAVAGPGRRPPGRASGALRGGGAARNGEVEAVGPGVHKPGSEPDGGG